VFYFFFFFPLFFFLLFGFFFPAHRTRLTAGTSHITCQSVNHMPCRPASENSSAAVADRRGIGFGWLQNAWLLLHARLKIHRGWF
jgi:hypothetical protein